MKKPSLIAAGFVLTLFVISNINCSKNNNAGPAAPTLHVQLQSAGIGNYLVDKNKHAIYFFTVDINGQDHCAGTCAVNWPAVLDSNLTADELGAGLTLSDFSTVKNPDGKSQLTYKGWPLYNFSPAGVQEAVGQVTGDGVNNIFYAAKPDYTIMLGTGQLVGNDGLDYQADFTQASGATTYFTDAWGNTLYAFANDSANHNKFTKSDFSNNAAFPIYDTSSIVVPSTLNKSLFSTTTVFGKTQMTYNGWPLYYFGADSLKRGNTKGVSLGPKKWPVITTATTPAPHP